MAFVLPEAKSTGTWGPPQGEEDFEGMKVSMIDKSDREWAALEDWSAKTMERQKTTAVDNNRAAVFVQKRLSRSSNRGRGGASRGGARGAQRGGTFAGRGNSAFRGGRGGRKANRKPRARTEDILYSSASILKKHTSTQIGEFDQEDLARLTVFNIPGSTDVKVCGLPRQYNDKLEQTRVTSNKPLIEGAGETPTNFTRCSAQEDPVLRELIKDVEGTCPIVITTDEVLSTLMASSRSVHSWHVQFFRFKRFIFINKPEDGRIDEEWVSENNTEDGPTESDAQEVDRITNIANESTEASRYFRRQCQQKSTAKGFKTEKNPFEKTSSMFKYRRYNMGEKADKYVLLVRSEIDAVHNDQQLRIFGLLEHIPSQKDKPWTRFLDTARATVLVNEVKTNKFKFTRWIAQSVLSGASLMKIGFISRVLEARTVTKRKENDPVTNSEIRQVPRIYPVKKEETVVDIGPNKSTHLHAVVGVETAEPVHFATQTGVIVANLWAIANLYISKFIAYSNAELGYTFGPDGEFVRKDANAPNDLSAFLMKHVNERRLEMFEQDEDEDAEEQDDEEDDEEDSGEDEEEDEEDSDDE